MRQLKTRRYTHVLRRPPKLHLHWCLSLGHAVRFSRQRRIQSVGRFSGTHPHPLLRPHYCPTLSYVLIIAPPSLTSSLLLPKSPQYLQAITNQWNARFQLNVPIPYAGFRMGVANVGARAELVGDVSRMVISTHIAIGACASVRVGWFSREWCNPSALTWLPVRVLQGPTFDFSRFCA